MLKRNSGLVKLEGGQCDDENIRGMYVKARIKRTEEELQSVKKLMDYVANPKPCLGIGASGSVLQVKWLGHQSALKVQKGVDKREATILKQLLLETTLSSSIVPA